MRRYGIAIAQDLWEIVSRNGQGRLVVVRLAATTARHGTARTGVRVIRASEGTRARVACYPFNRESSLRNPVSRWIKRTKNRQRSPRLSSGCLLSLDFALYLDPACLPRAYAPSLRSARSPSRANFRQARIEAGLNLGSDLD